ncbi:unnamed protein product [Diamesa tonsa]
MDYSKRCHHLKTEQQIKVEFSSDGEASSSTGPKLEPKCESKPTVVLNEDLTHETTHPGCIGNDTKNVKAEIIIVEDDKDDDVLYFGNFEFKTEGRDLCCICLDKTVNSVLIPCGHLTLCYGCAEKQSAKMKYFQNSGDGGEAEMAEEIKVPVETVMVQENIVAAKRVNSHPITCIVQANGRKITGADVIVDFQQIGTASHIGNGSLTANGLKMKEIKEQYLAQYKAVKESTITIVTWQGKKYMNMHANMDDYSCIKVDPVTDSSGFKWNSSEPFRDSDNSDSDESFDTYFISGSSSSSNLSSFTPDYPPGNQRSNSTGCPTPYKMPRTLSPNYNDNYPLSPPLSIPVGSNSRSSTIDTQDSDNLDTQGSSRHDRSETTTSSSLSSVYDSSNSTFTLARTETVDKQDSDNLYTQGSSGIRTNSTSHMMARILSPSYPPSPALSCIVKHFPPSSTNEEQNSDKPDTGKSSKILLNSVLMLVIHCGGFRSSHGEKIQCVFANVDYSVGNLYNCYVISLYISFNNMTVDGYTGTHLSNKNDNDVRAIWIHGTNTKYIPANLGSLSNLLALTIRNSQLVEIKAENFFGMQNLEILSFWNNKLTFVPSDAFSMLKKLKEIYLSNNPIKYIGSRVFDKLTYLKVVELRNNICSNKEYMGISAIIQLKMDIKANCMNPQESINILKQENKELMASIKEQYVLKKNHDELVKENDALIKEKYAVIQEQDALMKKKSIMKNEKDALKKEKDQFEKNKYVVVKIHDTAVLDYYALAKKFDVVVKEKDALIEEKEALSKEQYELAKKHDAMVNEKDTLKKEKDALQMELNNKTTEINELKHPMLNGAVDVKLNEMKIQLLKASQEHQMECQETIKRRVELSTIKDEQKMEQEENFKVINDLTNEKDQLMKESTDLKKESTDLKKELTDLKKELTEARDTIEQKLPKMDKTINELNMEVMEIKSQRKQERTTCRELGTKLMKANEHLATCEKSLFSLN